MSLTEILEEVRRLSPAEQKQVRATLGEDKTDISKLSVQERQELLVQEMLRKGLLRRLPTREKDTSDFRPIKIKGKPLSETIIEDRR